tara:strand:+ start:743 stop:940 length:198 start_codon:yes stop_codon:yes gene_type:complete
MTDDQEKQKSRSELQAYQDRRRAHNLFQVRLDEQTGNQLRSFMKQRNYNANQALKLILSRFFQGK